MLCIVEAARLIGVTRARMTQIGNLTLLSQTGESSDAPASFSDDYKEPFT